MALPSLSQRTPRESPTLATVSSLSDSRATRQVVPETGGGEQQEEGGEKEDVMLHFYKMTIIFFFLLNPVHHIPEKSR